MYTLFLYYQPLFTCVTSSILKIAVIESISMYNILKKKFPSYNFPYFLDRNIPLKENKKKNDEFR